MIDRGLNQRCRNATTFKFARHAGVVDPHDLAIEPVIEFGAPAVDMRFETVPGRVVMNGQGSHGSSAGEVRDGGRSMLPAVIRAVRLPRHPFS
jgi:hypothetical protein